MPNFYQSRFINLACLVFSLPAEILMLILLLLKPWIGKKFCRKATRIFKGSEAAAGEPNMNTSEKVFLEMEKGNELNNQVEQFKTGFISAH